MKRFDSTHIVPHELEGIALVRAAGHIKAGNDMTMPGSKRDIERILSALQDVEDTYHITREDLERCGVHIVNTIYRLTR